MPNVVTNAVNPSGVPIYPEQPSFLIQVIEDMEALLDEGRSAPPEVIRLWRSALRAYSPEINGAVVLPDTVTEARVEWERRQQ